MEKKRIQDDQIGSVALLTAAMLASGLSLAIVGAHPRRCSGARRSVRLEFESRQWAIEKAVAAEAVAEATQSEGQIDER